MYRYCYVIAVSINTLFACEFVNGVTISNTEISKLFATAEDLYRDNTPALNTIENLRMQYLCELANRDTVSGQPVNDGGIIATLESLIAAKK